MEALFEGHLMPAVPLDRAEREAAVAWLSALACITMKADTINIKYDDYVRKTKKGLDTSSAADQKPKYPAIDKEIQCIVDEKLSRSLDIRLAASWGDRLGLAEARGDGLRFLQSILQGYLGLLFQHLALADPGFQREAETALAKPGRDILLAVDRVSPPQAPDPGEQAT